VEFPLDRPEIRIGRQADCDIAVVDENVSRMHSLIRQTPTGLEITDLGSSNGTWLNGVKVTTARPLADRDIIRIGLVNFTVRFAAPPIPPPLPRGPVTIMADPGEGPSPFATGVVPTLPPTPQVNVPPPEVRRVPPLPVPPTDAPRTIDNSVSDDVITPRTPLMSSGGDLRTELLRLREQINPFIAEFSRLSSVLDSLEPDHASGQSQSDDAVRAAVGEFVAYLDAKGGEQKYLDLQRLLEEVRASSTDIRLLMQLSNELPVIAHLLDGYLQLLFKLKRQGLQ